MLTQSSSWRIRDTLLLSCSCQERLLSCLPAKNRLLQDLAGLLGRTSHAGVEFFILCIHFILMTSQRDASPLRKE